MSEIVVPTLGESVTEATVGQWYKSAGDTVSKDELIVELETDKVAVEVSAPEDGVLKEIIAEEGDTVEIGALLAYLGAGEGKAAASTKEDKKEAAYDNSAGANGALDGKPVAPSVRRIAAENDIDPQTIKGSGKDGRATKADALKAVEAKASASVSKAPSVQTKAPREITELEERVRMTRLRQTIASRLKEAQNTAAILTTFNDVDMSAVMATRGKYKEAFEKRHGIKLGFMSFFVKACVQALKEIPAVNAEIDGTDIIYKNYYNIGVAVGTDKGLVTPVVRDADQMSMAEIEAGIAALGLKARDGKLALDDLQGGTFTLSNGGIYGSLMSTPILNPPQSGVLGMHRIEKRPIVIDDKIEIRPMMYLALSYDHRIVDGKEAVTFLVRVKDCLENPERMLLDI